MCRDKSHSGRRCPGDTSEARQARRRRRAAAGRAEEIARACAASPAQEPPAIGSAGDVPATVEGLRARRQRLGEWARRQRLDDPETAGVVERAITDYGRAVDEWIESHDGVQGAREDWERSVEDYRGAEDALAEDRAAYGRAEAALQRARDDLADARRRAAGVDEMNGLRQAYRDAQSARMGIVEDCRAHQAGADAAYESLAEAAQAYGEARLACLGRIRPMGGSLSISTVSGKTPSPAIRSAMADTARFFPSDWIEASNSAESRLAPTMSKRRAHYAPSGTRINHPAPPAPDPGRHRRPDTPPALTSTGRDQGTCEIDFPDRANAAAWAASHGDDHLAAELRGYDDPEEPTRINAQWTTGTITVTAPASANEAARLATGRRCAMRSEPAVINGEPTALGLSLGWRPEELPDGRRAAIRPTTQETWTVKHHAACETRIPYGTASASNTSIHETTHRMEHTNPLLGPLERAYLTRRTGKDPRATTPTRLYPHRRGSKESVILGGGFYTDYAAKVYDGDDTHWEVSSTGTPLAFGRLTRDTPDPQDKTRRLFSRFPPEIDGMRDASHRAFVYGTLTTI